MCDHQTAWIDERELGHVSLLIESGHRRQWEEALQHIDLWHQRVHRLSAGIETTSLLLESLLVCENSSSSLSLSAALTRFLNLVVQAFERQLNVGRMTDLASRLNIPLDLVHLRHEATHGHMPDKTALFAAVKTALKWIVVNFWRPERRAINSFLDDSTRKDNKSNTNSHGEESIYIRHLLDCYGYLKIYSLWGHTHVSELKSQRALYKHVYEQWRLCFKDGRARILFQEGTMSKAIKKLLGELQRRLLHANNELDQSLVRSLVNDELLMPSQDFVNSLSDDDERKERPLLPTILTNAWTDVLAMIFNARPMLAFTLIEMLISLADNERALAWAVFILQRIDEGKSRTIDGNDDNLEQQDDNETFKKSKRRRRSNVPKSPSNENGNKKRTEVGVTRADVASANWEALWIQELKLPRSLPLLRALSKFVDTVSTSTKKKALELASIYMGEGGNTSTGKNELSVITMVSDVSPLERFDSVNEWLRADDIDWSMLPLGLSWDQRRESLSSILTLSKSSPKGECDDDDERILVITSDDENNLKVDWNHVSQSTR